MMKDEQIRYFLELHQEDFQAMMQAIKPLHFEQLWQPNPDAVSIANLLCHICEMEGFWIDHGLCGDAIDRDRQYEFDRQSDLSLDELLQRMQARMQRTQERVTNLSDDDYIRVRQFHGDTFTGCGILTWHSHHLGLHRGHIQTQVRWHLNGN